MTAKKNIKVLHLEDSPDDAELVLLEVRKGGFEGDWVRVDNEEDFRKHLDPSLDVIIADYSLPQFNALHAMHILEESGLDVPLVIVSGSIGEDLAVASIRAGAFDYVIKDRLSRLPQSINNAVLQRTLRADKRKAVEEQARLQDQLRQSQKMEAIGQLAGGVAHDFNNILQVILGNANLLHRRLGKEESEFEELGEILGATQRAAELTRRLLAFGRRQVLQFKDINLNTLIEALLKMMARLIGETIQLDFIPGHNLGSVHADAGQMDQVLMNLIINARDAMAEGGRMTIETENVTVNGEYRRIHPWIKAGQYVLLSVSDTGCGMDAETRERIFEPFFTTKQADRGTGLGLAMVYGIVKQHNGFIHVYSEVGRGTTFKIYLPLVNRQAAEIGHKIDNAAEGGGETILIAEDEAGVRDLTVRILKGAGYKVHVAKDGQEAVDLFEKVKDEVDLALLDAVMPKLNGRVACERIRQIRPDIPVLFSSGYSVNIIPDELIASGDVDLIQKPYDPDGLLRKIRSVLGKTKKV